MEAGIVFLIVLFVLGFCWLFYWAGSALAKKYDMDPILWGILCVLLGIWGIVILIVAGELKGGGKPFDSKKEVHHYYHDKKEDK